MSLQADTCQKLKDFLDVSRHFFKIDPFCCTWKDDDYYVVEELWEGGEPLGKGGTQVVKEKVEQGHWTQAQHAFRTSLSNYSSNFRTISYIYSTVLL